jgi:threonine synthase
MNFIETRGNDGVKKSAVTFSEALLNPSASFKGLYVPKTIPTLTDTMIMELSSLPYKALCKKIIQLFDIDVEDAVVDEAIALYDHFDDPSNPVPLSQVKEDLFISELWHGPTRAFKDLALQPFGSILSHLAKKEENNYLILAATSGDTGPAALDTFKNKENIQVACLYPSGGTSDIQRLQMVTMDANNLEVLGIKGDFDDAQSALKSLLASPSFEAELKKRHISLSAANSVNFGRIIFQIVYHIANYVTLINNKTITHNEPIYVIVPSGNFGNALGAYYAKKMGIPIDKILIASNENNILTELITTGKYDLRDKALITTTSPAMDILKSSNVERVLYDKFGPQRTKELMESLESEHYYELTPKELASLREDFDATFCDDAFAKSAIYEYAQNGYIMDPHTATCIKAYNELRAQKRVSIACSTAEWTKFSPTMLNAINQDTVAYSDKEAIERLKERLSLTAPASIDALYAKPVIHDKVIDKEAIENNILAFL